MCLTSNGTHKKFSIPFQNPKYNACVMGLVVNDNSLFVLLHCIHRESLSEISRSIRHLKQKIKRALAKQCQTKTKQNIGEMRAVLFIYIVNAFLWVSIKLEFLMAVFQTAWHHNVIRMTLQSKLTRKVMCEWLSRCIVILNHSGYG